MRRLGFTLAMVLLVGASSATIVYAVTLVTAPDGDGVIHACFDKGGKGAGKIRIVNEGTTCKDSESPLSWRALNTFGQLEGTPCSIGESAGTIVVTFDEDNVAKLVCDAPSICGDGITSLGEACDDGNAVNSDSCAACQSATCGDSFVWSEDGGTEECDDGPGGSATCSPTCQAGSVQGASCTASNQCQSDSCTDGKCCATACDGTCQACTNQKTGAPNGVCANIPFGTDPDAECSGSCNGAGACTP